ncbi:hypothetical protein [Pseudoalteromonas sp. P1-8]|uniref:hypothetical protein n=1 Tax=Pseudoalteromonas sp. P1-8 TaxID=1710353 RepID=UPI0006DCEC29|nr:hypothetical protein [Pseudoalteromonas sp. P1-8]KPW03623.1 hypothetical protein AN213_00785 [Pseudoalteromonas sp. P1-8]
MSNLLVFTPKHELDFQKNYADFIVFAKNELTLFGDHEFESPTGTQKGWECDKWSWGTARGKKLTIVFGNSENHSKYTPFKPPFVDFAKAYVRYEQSLNHKDSVAWASSLMWIYNALKEKAAQNDRSDVDIMHLNNTVINRVEEQIRNSKLGAGGKRNIGLSFEKVLKFIKDKRFKLDLQDWSNPFPRQSDSKIKLDKNSRKAEEDKCPSDYQMLQVADAFNKAITPRQKYFTSLCVMLMCQPSRSVELNGLTINSLQKSDKGRWYLMWSPAKGGDPVKKWVPKILEDVVRQAFDRLIYISAPARAAAKFAHENPDVFLVHHECTTPSDYPQDKPLNYNQFAKAMGFKVGRGSNGAKLNWSSYGSVKWLSNLINKLNGVSNWRKDLLRGGCLSQDNEILIGNRSEPTGSIIKFPSYRDLRSVVDQKYKTKDFPNYGDIKIWDCITLVRDNEFHKEFAVKPFSWVKVGHGAVSDAIGSARVSGKSIITSVFEELSITDEDGSRLKLNTHQLRHWLNTKLKLAGEEDWLIAKWSGRADIEQNKAYDGRTQEQKSRLTKRIGHVVNGDGVMTVAQANQFLSPYTSEFPPPAIVLHDLGLPVSLKSLGINRQGVAQFTGLGYCVHNYSESPCVKNGDCAVCSDHECLKGLPNTIEELKNLEKLYEEQLEDAVAKAGDKVFGADRWVTALGFRLSKIKTIITMIEDPNKPDGTPIRIPDELDPSPVKRSLNIDEQNVIPTFDLTALALSDLGES